MKAAVYKFQDAFINGDTAVDANSFDGLKKRLTGAQVVDAATNGLAVVGRSPPAPGVLRRPRRPHRRRRRRSARRAVHELGDPSEDHDAGRRLGGTDYITEDVLRRPGDGKRIPTYNGIPLLDIGTKGDGTHIIPQTETQGSSSVASSIYAVRFGQDEGDQASRTPRCAASSGEPTPPACPLYIGTGLLDVDAHPRVGRAGRRPRRDAGPRGARPRSPSTGQGGRRTTPGRHRAPRPLARSSWRSGWWCATRPAGPACSVSSGSAATGWTFTMMKFRTMSCTAAERAGRAGGAQPGRRRGALQDAQRPARHPDRPDPASLLGRRAPAAVERRHRGDVPRRPASGAAAARSNATTSTRAVDSRSSPASPGSGRCRVDRT